ncbi:hypothetical protein EON79_15630 [bacterium]|nr:MAG: hypothetical protein EON79_15630 [bacterium]
MRISNRTILAVVGVVALVTISTRIQSNTGPAVAEDITVAPQAEPPVTRYVGTRGSSATSRRAAAEVATTTVPIVAPAPRRTATDEESGARAQRLVEEEIPVEAPAPAEPTVNLGGLGFDDAGRLSVSTAEPTEPAQPGQLTDQAVYELFISNLDEENRRSFRATWALMSPEERQEWLVGARAALNN